MSYIYILLWCLGLLIMGSEAPTWRMQLVVSGSGFIMFATTSRLLTRLYNKEEKRKYDL